MCNDISIYHIQEVQDMMLTKAKVFTVRDNKRMSIGFNSGYKPYVLGFASETFAQTVANQLCIKTEIRLQRYRIEDVAEEINAGLRELGIDEAHRVKNASIDLEATITIPKRARDQKNKKQDFSIESIPYDEFLMYPFNKHLGIALPYDLLRDDDESFVFMSQVIDPSDCYGMFRNSLNLK